MKDVMVDLETLGTVPGSVILSIGAVAFDPTINKLGPRFYDVINIDSCVQHGLTKDYSTVQWWEEQSTEAQKVLHDASSLKTSRPLPAVLDEFKNGYLDFFGLDEVRVWGNGSDFDNSMLSRAYRAIGQPLPWKFWNNRCYRTLKSMIKVEKPTREGTHHNALDDAIFQARHAIKILRRYHSMAHQHQAGQVHTTPDA